MKKKAIFFDRDDCLILDRPYQYDPAYITYYEDTFSALKNLQSLDFLFFIVTNQSGVSRGHFTLDQMHLFHDKIRQDFERNQIHIQEIAFCPHAPKDNCTCRKPSPEMVNKLIKKYKIDPKTSFFIGDKVIDAECGVNAGMEGCLVHNSNPAYPSFTSLTEFSLWVLAKRYNAHS